MNTLRDVVKAAFIAIHCGRSTDDVVINPELNAAFISECRKRLIDVSEFAANWKLMNLRKSASLGDVTTDRVRIDHSLYEHASQIAARFMEDKSELTIDRVLCDPEARSHFDAIALSIAPEVSVYQLRKAALGLRGTGVYFSRDLAGEMARVYFGARLLPSKIFIFGFLPCFLPVACL
ncbi:MAG: hypothetical protein R3E01_19230 [Pirellulaceae bacterium]